MAKPRLTLVVPRVVLVLGAIGLLACPAPRNEPVMEPGLNPPAGGSRADGGGSSGMNRGQDGPEPSNQVCGSACEAEKSDGCCPVGCTAASDIDCASQCGNGVIEKGEECDPPSSCPASCPNRGCTKFTLEGEAAMCTALCREAGMQTVCQPDDGCCPMGCTGNDDNDCLVMCGNGAKEGSETCDPLASCPTACPQEGCQLRKLVNAGTCTAECVNDRQQTTCVAGDGCCPPGCHGGNDADCMAACDNGVKESGETCDPLASCPTTCPARECQLRKLVNGGTCKAQCVDDRLLTACTGGDDCCPPGCNSGNDSDCAIKCGNGVKEAGETCDPLSSCPSSCPAMGCQLRELRNAGTCKAACENSRTQTACASNDDCCPGACHNNNDSDCEPRCGNGVVERGETCEPAAECTRRQTACRSDQNTIRQGQGNPATCTFECSESARPCGPADGNCPAGCSNDPDCKRANGAECTSPGQCLSNRCTDGRCCSQTCGTCERCTGSGGTCVLPANTKVCNGSCIASSQCCDCDTTRRCSNGNMVQGRCSSGTCSQDTENCNGNGCSASGCNECRPNVNECPSPLQARRCSSNGRLTTENCSLCRPCSNGTCQPKSCPSGSTCNPSNGQCVPDCGGEDERCCQDFKCNSPNLVCGIEGQAGADQLFEPMPDRLRCIPCGRRDELCCGARRDSDRIFDDVKRDRADRCSQPGMVCPETESSDLCTPCGVPGSPCCLRGTPCQGTTCNQNFCVCGAFNQACCPGDFPCFEGSCQGTAEGDRCLP
jgi:hypothetical protein